MTRNINYIKPVAYPAVLKLSPAPPKGAIRQAGSLKAALIHEVRNPLTNINLSVEMLKPLLTDDLQQMYLDIIKRASLKINTLITELVRYQQPEQVHPGKYSMHQLLNEVLLMADDRLSLKNIIVSTNYATTDYNKTTGRPRMKIALTNIIINAIDAMKQDGRLIVTTKSIAGRYTIQIEDNGCGIDAESIKHIFKPYFTSKEDGLGIGLAAAQIIFKANKVKINVESEKGAGTKFTLTFAKRRTVFLVK